MNILNISQARAKLPELVERAERLFDRFVITQKGKAKAVLMSASEFESWEETLFTLANRKTLRQIRQAEADWKAGRREKFISLAKLNKK